MAARDRAQSYRTPGSGQDRKTDADGRGRGRGAYRLDETRESGPWRDDRARDHDERRPFSLDRERPPRQDTHRDIHRRDRPRSPPPPPRGRGRGRDRERERERRPRGDADRRRDERDGAHTQHRTSTGRPTQSHERRSPTDSRSTSRPQQGRGPLGRGTGSGGRSGGRRRDASSKSSRNRENATAADTPRAALSPELDFCSESFDPAAALAAAAVQLPCPDAVPMDNLTKFNSVVLESKEVLAARAAQRKAKLERAAAAEVAAAQREDNRRAEGAQRRQGQQGEDRARTAADGDGSAASTTDVSGEPSRAPPPSTQSNKTQRHVLAFMQDRACGPLTTLGRAMKGRHRIAVQVRGKQGRHGVCVGSLLAFDKHLNLVLGDVVETAARRQLQQPTAPPPDLNPRQRARWAKPKVVTAETVRHHDQLLVRGSAVITVALAAAP